MSRERQDLKIYVEELIIAESGTYKDQFLRPYVTEVKGGMISRIEERYAKARKFTPSILANIANQFIVPDSFARGVIEIPHGWSERRGRFVLILSLELGTGDRLKQVVIGYTNSVGFTVNNVDHDMEFFVNSTFMLKERLIRGHRGISTSVWVPHMTNDVLSDRYNSGIRRSGPELYTMRPEDVYSTIDASQTTELVDSVTDLRTTLSRNAIKSNTSNRLAPQFMSRVLGSRQRAMEASDYGNPVSDVNATAQGYVSESYASDDYFLREISKIHGSNMVTDNFTFRDLTYLDVDAERRTRTMLLEPEARASTRYDQEERRLDGQEEEDRIGALVGMAVPALMMECGLAQLSFQVDNQGIQHAWEFRPENARSFMKDVDCSSFVDTFENRLLDELLLPITGGNDFDIGLQVDCRIFGEVNFTMFWNGEDHGRFVFPCFTNSLASPIVTDSRADVKKMSDDFKDLFDELLSPDLLGGSGGGGRSSY